MPFERHDNETFSSLFLVNERGHEKKMQNANEHKSQFNVVVAIHSYREKTTNVTAAERNGEKSDEN